MGKSVGGHKIEGVIAQDGDEYRLTLRVAETQQRVAVVVGDLGYLERALVALTLPPSLVRDVSKDRNGARLAFVRRKPTHGHAKSAR